MEGCFGAENKPLCVIFEVCGVPDEAKYEVDDDSLGPELLVLVILSELAPLGSLGTLDVLLGDSLPVEYDDSVF